MAIGIGAGLLAAESRAAEPKPEPPRFETHATSPPRTPAPFVLPELAHERLDLQLDWFYGNLTGNPGVLRSNTNAGLVRVASETNLLLPRRLYLGVAYPIGFALPPDGGLAAGEGGTPAGSRALAGNIEAHVRTVFPMPTFLEIGFVLGVVAPTAGFSRNSQGDRSAAAAVGSLDPTNYVDFLPGRTVLRPAGDLRITRGPLLFQGRHGLDVIFDDKGLDSVTIAGRLIAHVGFVIYPSLEVSFEAQQYYVFTADPKVASATTPAQVFNETYRFKDGSRSALTIGPALRGATRNWDFGVAFMTNIADPISPVVDRMLGFRFSVIAHVERPKAEFLAP